MHVSQELETIISGIHSSNSTIGKIIYQDSIYNELKNVISNMDNLLIDIQNNPKKYINISIWGNDKKNSK